LHVRLLHSVSFQIANVSESNVSKTIVSNSRIARCRLNCQGPCLRNH